MRTAIAPLDLRRPKSLEEALAIQHREHRTPLAGATDLYVALNFGTLTSTRFLDLWGLAELKTITQREKTLVVGSLVTYTELIRSPLVATRLPMLVAAARQVAGLQIQ